jgi:nicotinamidase/pyrazinamidase
MTEVTPVQAVKARKPHKILVSIDTQVDFVMEYGKLPVPGAENIVVPGVKLLNTLDPQEFAAVIFTYDTHEAEEYNGSLENVGNPETGAPGFPIHCERNTPGWENVFNPSLIPEGIQFYELEKDVFDMWEKEETYLCEGRQAGNSFPRKLYIDRDKFFKYYIPVEVDTVVIIGVASDFCVLQALRGFVERGYKVEVVENVTAGIFRDIRTVIDEEFSGQITLI